ncbi:Hypothetical predicted protein, partial [Olea europaea subsp. europaea]
MKGKRHDNSQQPANCSNTIDCDTKKSASCNDQQHPRKRHLYSIPIEDQHDQKSLDIFRSLSLDSCSREENSFVHHWFCLAASIMGYLGNKLTKKQIAGRVFKDWEEGTIDLAPTYQYLVNCDHYVVQLPISKEKQRTPA